MKQSTDNKKRAVYDDDADLAYAVCDSPRYNPILTGAYLQPASLPLSQTFLQVFGHLENRPSPTSNTAMLIGWKKSKVYMIVVLGLLSLACLSAGVIVGVVHHSAELGATVGASVAAIPTIILALMAVLSS